MVDYYSILLRAVTAPGAGDAQWRRGVYDRARQMLAQQLRTRRPPTPQAGIDAELDAMDAAVDRLEAEMSWADDERSARDEDISNPGIAAAGWREPDRGPIATPWRPSGTILIAAAVAVAALGAGGYLFWAETHKSKAPPVKTAAVTTAPNTAKPATASPAAPAAAALRPEKDGDLAPGVDGGSSDPDQAYVYRRQPTFYRTLQPAGTIIVDKLQHFLYLIQPNNVALRYGIGLGNQCADLVGLRHIANKAEWPPWQPPPELRRYASAGGSMPGGAGNPLGARLLDLDDGKSRINGTNAPKTIGSAVTLGCIRLVNDDIVDLYNRVNVSTPVLVN